MEELVLSRKKLESLTNDELSKLADEYGLDIPSNLNRNFIIGELLEYAQELEDAAQSDGELSYVDSDDADEENESDFQLPKSYNETKINAVLRNPAWVYAFWDISEADIQSFEDNEDFSNLGLHVAFFDNEDSETQSDSIDLMVSLEDRNQYILLSSAKKNFVLSLEAYYTGKPTLTLARSKRISVPTGNLLLKDAVPGKNMDFPPLIRLSGIDSVLRRQYLDHREMFSESDS
ncbi:MAG: DUF4912 domain-containing protein [Treponema sp.]|nr:DUF4912 domain-containing protein [Treponema sp.]MBQ6567525.1 DUF4912 domain-containing protein [Treponema sp.]MBQ7166852.1 DUF4912 domain-containing protein [Treponema sp.]